MFAPLHVLGNKLVGIIRFLPIVVRIRENIVYIVLQAPFFQGMWILSRQWILDMGPSEKSVLMDKIFAFPGFLTHGYSVGVFVSHRYHSISISAFFCVLIASSLLCAPGRNRLDQSRTSLEDFSREPVRPVYTLDLLFICSNLHCKNCSAFIEKEFIPVAFLSYTCS